MSQYTINIGAIPNDGTGDPLRTAFNETNLNFDQIFAAGPVLSNIQIANNTILTTNTNGNLVLAPNGIGVVQSNVSIVPNTANIRNLGSANSRWATAYMQYANISGGISVADLTATGDLTVGGNLTVTGDIVQIGNLVTDAKTIQLANTAVTANSANGSGITVGSNDNIATVLYNSVGNVWTTNIGISAVGNISAPYFIGNGSLLTGITSYSNANVATYLASGTNTANIITTGNISGNYVAGNIQATGGEGSIQINRNGILGTASYGLNYDNNDNTLYVVTGSFFGNLTTGVNALYAGGEGFTVLGSAVMAQFTGNVPNYSQINFQNTSNSAVASGDYIITADNGNDSTHFINLGLTGSNWNGTQPNSLGNRLGANDGYLYVQDGNLVIGTVGGVVNTWKFGIDGNVTAGGNILLDNSISAVGNVTAANFVGNGNTLSNVATQVTGEWFLPTGVNNVSITIPESGTYSIWINGNIPNGIVTYTATVVLTNNNVAVLGTQSGWYYPAPGNALVLDSIPDQIVGTNNAISNAMVVTTTANVFEFGITNNSGNVAVVSYGYTKL